MEIVFTIEKGPFKIFWINAISKYGYIALEKYDNQDCTEMWLIGEKVGIFFKTFLPEKAEAIAFHCINKPNKNKRLCIFPRYNGDYEDNNETYQIADNDNQKKTGDFNEILNLKENFENFLFN